MLNIVRDALIAVRKNNMQDCTHKILVVSVTDSSKKIEELQSLLDDGWFVANSAATAYSIIYILNKTI